MRYKAFMSYSHAVDGKLAPGLQSALHRFAKPWYRTPTIKIFRDKTSLSANPALWSAIEAALGESEYFLLLASPEAASSQWVQKEVDCWIKNAGPKHIILVLTGGDVAWDIKAGDFDWQKTTALPQNLKGVFRQEPLYVDLRWIKTVEHVAAGNPMFRNAVADVGATLHNRPKDDLVSEDINCQRSVKRLVIGTLTLLLLLATAMGWQAYVATQQARIANIRQLVAQSLSVAVDYPQRAIVLASEALSRAQRFGLEVHAAESAVSSALNHASGRTLDAATTAIDNGDVISRGGAHWFGQSPDKEMMFDLDKEGSAKLWNLMSDNPSKDVTKLASQLNTKEVSGVAMSKDKHWLAIGYYNNQAILWDLSDRLNPRHYALPRRHEKGVTHVEFSPDGRWLVTAGPVWSGDITPPYLWNLDPKGEFLKPVPLRGHDGGIHHLEFSSDGKWLVTVAEPYRHPNNKDARPEGCPSVLLWPMDGHKPPNKPYVLPIDESATRHVAFSPDGRWLARSGWRDEILLWDLAVSGPFHPPHKLTTDGRDVGRVGKSIARILFSPGSLWLLAGVGDSSGYLSDSIQLWDLTGHVVPQATLRIEPSGGRINIMDFSSDDNRLMTGDWNGVVNLWDLSSNESISRPVVLQGHSGSITCAVFGPDLHWLVTGSADKTLRLWDLTSSQVDKTAVVLRGHDAPVRYANISRDGRWLGSVDDLFTARIWDLSRPDPSNSTLAYASSHSVAKALPLGSGDRWIVVEAINAPEKSGRDIQHIVNFISTSDHAPFRASLDLGSRFERVQAIALSNDKLRLFTGGRGKATHPPLTLDFLENFKELLQKNPEMAMEKFKERVLQTVRVNGYLWDLSGGLPIGLKGFSEEVVSAAISPDDRWLAIGGGDGLIGLWDLTASELSTQPIFLKNHNGAVSSLVFASGSALLASRSDSDNKLVVWKPRPEERKADPIIIDSGVVGHVVISHDGRFIAAPYSSSPETASVVLDPKQVAVWDLSSPEPAKSRVVLTLEGFSIGPIIFGPSAQSLYLATIDGVIHRFNLSRGKEVDAVRLGRSVDLAVSRDGKHLVAADDSPFFDDQKTVRVFNLAADGWIERSSTTLFGNSRPAAETAFSDDGRRIAIFTRDSRIHVFEVTGKGLLERAHDVSGRNLTQEEWEIYLSGDCYRPTFE